MLIKLRLPVEGELVILDLFQDDDEPGLVHVQSIFGTPKPGASISVKRQVHDSERRAVNVIDTFEFREGAWSNVGLSQYAGVDDGAFEMHVLDAAMAKVAYRAEKVGSKDAHKERYDHLGFWQDRRASLQAWIDEGQPELELEEDDGMVTYEEFHHAGCDDHCWCEGLYEEKFTAFTRANELVRERFKPGESQLAEPAADLTQPPAEKWVPSFVTNSRMPSFVTNRRIAKDRDDGLSL